MPTHEYGPWHLDNGLFVNQYCTCTNDPAVCIDNEAECIIKISDAETVKDFARKKKREVTIIEFDRYPGAKLDADEICTLMNYMSHVEYERVKLLLQTPEPEIKEKLQTLAKLGY